MTSRSAANSAMLDQGSAVSTGAGAPQIATLAAEASASTASGVPIATTHQTQPTRHRTIRAPQSR